MLVGDGLCETGLAWSFDVDELARGFGGRRDFVVAPDLKCERERFVGDNTSAIHQRAANRSALMGTTSYELVEAYRAPVIFLSKLPMVKVSHVFEATRLGLVV